MRWYISKTYTNLDFGGNPNLDDKIEIFRDRVEGWQIEIAEQLNKIEHSGYGVISVLFSYFEMIAEHRKGESSHKKSKLFFIDGFKDVFPLLFCDDHIGNIYDRVRCGMYHSGYTKAGVQIGSMFPTAVSMHAGYVLINPEKLTAGIKEHFKQFVSILQMPEMSGARANFKKMFDAAIAAGPAGSLPPNTGFNTSGPQGRINFWGSGPPPSGSR